MQAREQRAALLRDELKAQDARIEAIVTALQSITDSKDSRTKVTRLKETTIGGLMKNLEYFRQKRRGIAVFDARLEQRVAQILALQKSFPTHRDYERYQARDGGDWGVTYSVNEDHRQNQRLTAHTNAQRDELTAGLRRNIERLEQQNRALKTQGASAALKDRSRNSETPTSHTTSSFRFTHCPSAVHPSPDLHAPVDRSEVAPRTG